MQEARRGFSLPLVITTILVLGVAGFLIWRLLPSDAPKQQTTTSQNSGDQQEKIDPNQGYFVIKEWGVRFKPVDGVGVVVYKALPVTGVPAGDGSGIVLPEGSVKILLSTQELVALSPDCDVNQDATGVWELYRSSQSLSVSDNVLLGKVGEYYYYYFHSQAACVMKEADYDINSKISSLLFDSFKTLELAQ